MKSKFLVLGAALSIMGAAVLASPAFAGVAGSGHSDAPNWGQHNGVAGSGHSDAPNWGQHNGVEGGGHSDAPNWGQHNGVEGTGHAGVDGSGHNAIPKCLELGCGGN